MANFGTFRIDKNTYTINTGAIHRGKKTGTFTPFNGVRMMVDSMYILEIEQELGDKLGDVLTLVQKAIDSQVINLVEPYMPESADLNPSHKYDSEYPGAHMYDKFVEENKQNQHIGYIQQSGPHVKYLYFGNEMKYFTKDAAGNEYSTYWAPPGGKKRLTGAPITYNISSHLEAGPYWFARMSSDKGQDILKFAKTVAKANMK